MIQRCFALSYYLYCLRLRCLVSFLFYSTIDLQTAFTVCSLTALSRSVLSDYIKTYIKTAMAKNGGRSRFYSCAPAWLWESLDFRYCLSAINPVFAGWRMGFYNSLGLPFGWHTWSRWKQGKGRARQGRILLFAFDTDLPLFCRMVDVQRLAGVRWRLMPAPAIYTAMPSHTHA
ncbi:Uncharacterised protein [Neisseria animalis]|nr:Uncharacterised protein [Neisseria animalis]